MSESNKLMKNDLKTNNLRFNTLVEDAPWDTPYVEVNVDRLSSKLIHMNENGMYISYSSYRVSGMIEGQYPNKEYRFPMQKHEGFDLNIVIEGHLTENVNGSVYTLGPGDILLVNPNCRVAPIIPPGCVVYGLEISRSFLKRFLKGKRMPELPPFISSFFLSSLIDDEYRNADYIRFINTGKEAPFSIKSAMKLLNDELREKKPGYDDIVTGIFCRIMYFMNDTCNYKIDQQQFTFLSDEELVERIKAFLDENRKKITLSELAEQFHYHQNYLNAVFQKVMKESVRQYNQKICMHEAKNLLRQGNLSISAVAEAVGYSSRSQFYAAFEKINGVKPSQIRDDL